MILCCALLSACGENPVQDAEELRSEYRAYNNTELHYTASFSPTDAVSDFELQFSGSPEGGTVHVLAPESVEGLSMEIREDGGALICDGAVLDAGTYGSSGLSPVGAGPLVFSLWQTGYLSECRYETLDGRETVAFLLSDGEGVTLTSWMDRETHLPVRCEAAKNGQVILTLLFQEAKFY